MSNLLSNFYGRQTDRQTFLEAIDGKELNGQ